MSLEFSTMYLVIEEERASAENLKPAFREKKDRNSSDGANYLISKEVLNDEHFWLCAHYGKSLPRSPIVYNSKKEKEENNPRSTDQTEPTKQLFALYSTNSQILYLSNQQKQSWVEKYLKTKLNQDDVIKAFLKTPEEFLQQIKSIEKVRFVAKRNLFMTQSGILDIFPSPNDLFGLDVPEDFTLEANFANASVKKAFIKNLKKMVSWKNNCEAESLVCIGRDDRNLETIFNVDSFIQKVSVDIDKNEQGFYDPATTKQALIDKIENLQ